MSSALQSAEQPARRDVAAEGTGPTDKAAAMTLNGAPPVQRLLATARLLNTRANPVAQRAANRTGLPDSLKAGIEAASGQAMDDVRVHRNSPMPAQLQAHAYAQGTDIHLAPGQEKHLPHEAWHVVQQKQGRVSQTADMDGVAINDDRGLEQEADVRGASAARGAPMQLMSLPLHQPWHANSSDMPIQRAPVVYQDGSSLRSKTKKTVVSIAEELEKSVTFADEMVRANPLLTGVNVSSGAGYLSAWVDTFNAMVRLKAIPEFFYARYGYAVETIASAKMPRAIGGLAISTQYATGATRPDFVVWKGKEDIAWLDITSSGSVGHILRKQHGGWASRPYVAEILYSPPGIDDFSNKGLSLEQQQALTQISSDTAQNEEDYATGLDAVSILVEEALDDLATKTGKQITKSGAKVALLGALKHLFTDITATEAGEVVRCIDHIEVQGYVDTGASWSNFAFKGQGYKDGRAMIIAYGKSLREKGNEMIDEDSSN